MDTLNIDEETGKPLLLRCRTCGSTNIQRRMLQYQSYTGAWVNHAGADDNYHCNNGSCSEAFMPLTPSEFDETTETDNYE